MARRPPLQLIPAFEASARLRSFKQAAEELHVTPSAISQQIRALEECLGLPLFKRLARKVELTEAGQQFFDVAQRLVQDYERGYRHFREQFERPVFRVSMTTLIAHELVLPNLHEFQRQYPDIDVRVETSMALVDFDRDAVDAAIRFGLPESFHCESLPLAPCRATVVGSAKLLADNPLRRPEDVAAHTLIHVRREPNDWQIAARWAGLPEFKPRRELYLFDDFSPLLAASRGQGLAFALLPAACNWLLDGRLTTPFPWAAPMEQSYFYAFRRNQKPRRGLMEFYHWVREVFEGMAARCPL